MAAALLRVARGPAMKRSSGYLMNTRTRDGYALDKSEFRRASLGAIGSFLFAPREPSPKEEEAEERLIDVV